jgi:hypothetical protein
MVKLLTIFKQIRKYGEFEVLVAVIMNNTNFWVVTPYTSEGARRFGKHVVSIFSVETR